MDKPIAKITAAVTLIGTLAAYFLLVWHGVDLPTAGFAFVGGLAGSAATFLFMAEVMPRNKEIEN